MAYSRDGKYIATGALVVQIVEAQTGKIIHVIERTGTTKEIAFSPRGRIFSIAASSKFKIPIFDIESGMKLAELDEGLREGFSAETLAFSPDGSVLATASSVDIKIWDVESQRVLVTWRAHAPYILSIAYSPDGKTIASGGFDKVVKLWDAQTGKLVRSMSGHTSYINQVAFSPDGKTLATCSEDFTIRIWDVATGKCVKTLTEKYFIRSLAFTPDGKTLAATVFNSIKLWSL